MRIRPIAAFAVALVLTACGRLDSSVDEGIEHPAGAGRLVLRVEITGGFVAPDFALRRIPEFSLYGDGRIITEGPQIEIYPGPALPNVLATPIDEEGIQAILRAAHQAGLFGPDRRYEGPTIADAPTTTFTLFANGKRHVTSAYALGEGMEGAGIASADREARAKLADFGAKLSDLRSWLPRGSIGEETVYRATELRVFVQPYSAAPEQGLREPAQDWPLATPLGSFGEPVAGLQDTRCGTVWGDDLAKLLPEAEASNELTRWLSLGIRYRLLFRPLLPDEHGC